MYLGVDIGGTAVKYGLVDGEGNVCCMEEYSTCFDGYKTPILDAVLSTSRKYIRRHMKDNEPLLGIGISATGQIDIREGVVAGTGGNIKNWDKSRIRDAFMECFQLPCSVINDANCVALGEMWAGSARGCSDFVVITVGTGIGGGIVAGGTILQGKQGFAGEIGHMIIDKNGRRCTCGNKGCLEQYASVTALIQRVTERCPDLAKEEMNGRQIFDLVRRNHQEVSEVVKEWIGDISTGIISLIHLLNPELLLVGGGVSAQQELFIEPLTAKITSGLMSNFSKNLLIKGATLGNSAGLIGAVYNLKHF